MWLEIHYRSGLGRDARLLVGLVLATVSGSTEFAEVLPSVADSASNLVLVPEDSMLAATVQATAHSFEARVERFSSTLAVDPQSGRPTEARLQFDFADIRTGNESRDEEMLLWLEHDKHPVAEARLLAVETADTETTFRCMLRMHGQEQEITVPVTIGRPDESWLVEGAVTIDHRDWGLPKIRKFLFLTVDPHLRVHFRLRFRPAEASTTGPH